jgi:hypothetical protein
MDCHHGFTRFTRESVVVRGAKIVGSGSVDWMFDVYFDEAEGHSVLPRCLKNLLAVQRKLR